MLETRRIARCWRPAESRMPESGAGAWLGAHAVQDYDDETNSETIERSIHLTSPLVAVLVPLLRFDERPHRQRRRGAAPRRAA